MILHPVLRSCFLPSLLLLCLAVFPLKAEETKIPYKDLQTFANVFGLIKNLYVEEREDKDLMRNAISGMLSGLDPHSTYLSADQYNNFKIRATGRYGGLGIEVSMQNGFVQVVAPFEDTPADRAGIKAGDLILKLDDKSVKGMAFEEAIRIMRGEPGTKIRLTIAREGEEQPLNFELKREIIKIRRVTAELLDKDFAYVRISSFQGDAAEQMIRELKKMRVQHKRRDFKGLVLDLRNNPGGFMNAAVKVAETFLDGGMVTFTKGRKKIRERHIARRGDFLRGAPMVVLVNRGSASASEIVAGALKDHKRALVIGSRTFGKASVQSVQPLPGGGAVKLTTARYYTPSGKSIQARGIEPDFPVSNLVVQKAEKPIDDGGEAALSGHLLNTDEDTKEAKPFDYDDLAQTDYVLFVALSLLKGVGIFSDAGKTNSL